MEFLSHLKDYIDPKVLIENFGYAGIFTIVFAESGLFFGFFLPGDSLLLVAGVLAAAGILKIHVLIPLIFVAAILGDQVGYWTGFKFGRKLLESKWFKFIDAEHVKKSEEFFAKHGHKAIVLSRFVPIVRTFTPIVAGISDMPYKTFVSYNVLGAVLWGIGITVAGYLLGNVVPNVDKYIHYIIAIIIVASFVPVFAHLRPSKKK